MTPLVVISVLLAVVLIPVAVTGVCSRRIRRRNPPVGSFVTFGTTRLHFVHVKAAAAELPPVVFLHGASSNLKDQMVPLRPLLEGRTEMLFFDRPGLGWSTRGAGNDTPRQRGLTLARLMDSACIEKAILVGHSYGAAEATAFALAYPDRIHGLVLLTPATHPWLGGSTAWYYKLTALPVLGHAFAMSLALPAGAMRLAAATRCVFAPNRMPDGYAKDASIELVLRPSAFRANAVDMAALYREVLEAAPHYRHISAPTIVISGDSDTVVDERIHSLGLARDIGGSELILIRNLGHKPDWIVPELVAAAIEAVAGRPRDLHGMARDAELRLASEAYGMGACGKARGQPVLDPSRPLGDTGPA